MSITLHETPSEKMGPVKEEVEEQIASESAPNVSAASDYMERLQKDATDGQIVSLLFRASSRENLFTCIL